MAVDTYAHVSSIIGNQISYTGSSVFRRGDKVLVIQMTGALAGNWQFDSVVTGGNPVTVSSIYVTFSPNNTTDLVQVIKVPQYTSLRITPAGTLTAIPWNGSTGGVLSFVVRDTFTIDSGGRCDVSLQGFAGGTAGVAGIGGAGGTSGAAGLTQGANGGNIGLAVNTGIGGGGDGGLTGAAATGNIYAAPLNCPGCGAPASNQSTISNVILNTKLMLGAAGAGGSGGAGGVGGGGGGGGAGATGIAQNGTSGNDGGNGGNGGVGGNGGGLIVFAANYLNLNAHDTIFVAKGQSATGATAGTIGGIGGDGGIGGGPTCLQGGGGGGGGGAYGGSGGNGGSGGSGGTVYPIVFNSCPAYTSASCNVRGGSGGHGAIGGAGGHGGQNAGIVGGFACLPIDTSANGYGPPIVSASDSCNMHIPLMVLDTIHHRGNGTVHTFADVKIYGSGSDSVWAEQLDSFTVIVYTIRSGLIFYTTLSDPGYHHNPMHTVDQLFYTGGVSYDTTAIGYVMGIDTLSATCPHFFRADPPDGLAGADGTDGDAGGSGGAAGGAVVQGDCISNPIYTTDHMVPQGEGCSSSFDPIQYVYAVGGTQPYSYNYIVSYDLPGINSTYDLYTVTISDISNCVASEYITVDHIADEYFFNIQNSDPTSCPNASDGDLTYYVSDITRMSCVGSWTLDIYGPNGYYYFDQGYGYVSPNVTLNQLAAGNYTYDMTSYGANSITYSSQGAFDILSSNLIPTGDEYDTICYGASFYWAADGNTYTQTGSYTTTISGGSIVGCDTVANLHLTVSDPIIQTLYAPTVIGDNCFQPDPIFELGVSGGDGHYTLTNSVPGAATCIGNSYVTPYMLEVTDGHQCTAQLTDTVVEVYDLFQIGFGIGVHTTCANLHDGEFDFNISQIGAPISCYPRWTLEIYDTAGTNVAGTVGYSAGNSLAVHNLDAGNYSYKVLSLSASGSCSQYTDSGTFTIVIGSTVTVALYDTICSGSSVTWGGSFYTQDGLYSRTLTGGAVNGCDSTVTLHLTVLQPIVANNTSMQTIGYGCATVGIDYSTLQVTGGDGNYSFNSYPTGGPNCMGNIQETEYNISITDGHGCNAQVQVSLGQVQDRGDFVVDYTEPATCSGINDGSMAFTITNLDTQECHFSYMLSIASQYGTVLMTQDSIGMTDTLRQLTAGTYQYALTGMGNCIVPIYGTFDIQPNIIGPLGYEYDTICQGSTFLWRGVAYSASGSYSTIVYGGGMSGCDSTAYLELYVTPAPSSTTYATICTGNSYTWGGQAQTQTGSYVNAISIAGGCDSLAVLELTVNDTIPHVVTDTICQGEAYMVGHHSYTSSGVYTDMITAASSCDTLQTLQLVVLQSVTPSLVISVSHGPVINGQQIDTFRADYTACDGAFYSWYLNLVPQGLHDSIAVISHFVNQADSIVCRIDCQNRCASTTYTYSNRIMSGINDPASFLHSVSVYPNPNAGAFTLEVNSDIATTAQLSLLDVIGQNVLTDQMLLRTGDNKHQIQLPESAASGVYILQLSVEGHTLYQRATVER
ncbi:MAG: T9SS type A sorting domain-containing protein [Bacteroidetes bacterium]|nr:T9SS type A sorting domain-containing protein [Bacteroidota bacterium]